MLKLYWDNKIGERSCQIDKIQLVQNGNEVKICDMRGDKSEVEESTGSKIRSAARWQIWKQVEAW
jgi:hypothetical protein